MDADVNTVGRVAQDEVLADLSGKGHGRPRKDSKAHATTRKVRNKFMVGPFALSPSSGGLTKAARLADIASSIRFHPDGSSGLLQCRLWVEGGH